MSITFLGSDAQMAEMIGHCAQLDCIVGGPDVLPNADIQGNRVFTGESPESDAVDYRGEIPFAAEIQTPELGGKEGTFTPEQLYEHASIDGAVHSTACPSAYPDCTTN